jgi:hypothetical protein
VKAATGVKEILFPKHSANADESQVTSQPLFVARLALLDLAVDDDEDVRAEAAEVLMACQNRDDEQVRVMGAALGDCSKRALSLSKSCNASVDAAWTWMDRHYSSLQSTLWQEEVVRILERAQQQLHFQGDGALFAEEKVNQFVNEIDQVERGTNYCRRHEIGLKSMGKFSRD